MLANFVEKISHGSNNDSEEVPTVGEMEVILILPYLGESSLRFEKSVTSFLLFKVLIIKLILKSSLKLPVVYQICFELKTLYLKGSNLRSYMEYTTQIVLIITWVKQSDI